MQESIVALLHYCYTDELMDLSPENLMNCHHAAIYYDIPYMAQLCENAIVECLDEASSGDPSNASQHLAPCFFAQLKGG